VNNSDLNGPVSIPVSLWLGSWELVAEALNNCELYALEAEIEDQVAQYLGG
jgi:hypothetical protein